MQDIVIFGYDFFKQATILVTNKTLGNDLSVVAQEHSKIQTF
jgi:hypothetical protein